MRRGYAYVAVGEGEGGGCFCGEEEGGEGG